MKKGQTGYQRKEQEHFDGLAEATGETWWGNRTAAAPLRMRRRARLVAGHLARFTDPCVLELGCGTGTFSRHVLEELPALHLVGCDISPKAVEIAAASCAGYPQARFEVADGTALAAPDATFDAVIGSSILHHLFPLESILRECFRVLKPGGLFWFSEPNMMNPQIMLQKNVRWIGRFLQDTEDETAFFRWSLAKTLRAVGFEEVSVWPYDFLHPLVPRLVMGWVDRVGRLAEKIPLLREISGSLVIQARRPSAGDPAGQARPGAIVAPLNPAS
jgi:ubiquinone/menaquinone biosynthesis C-methylase UbiE